MRKRKLLIVESNDEKPKKPKKTNKIEIKLPGEKDFVLEYKEQKEVVESIRLIFFLNFFIFNSPFIGK